MTVLAARDLSVARGGATLLSSVSLAAKAGEFIAVVGPNGAGKSTLLRALAGLEPVVAGEVTLGDSPLRSLGPRERARSLAYLPQLREINWSVTVETVVALGRFAYGSPGRLRPADREAVDGALAAADLDGLRLRVAQTLSGGEQARMHLARALAAETPVLLADEPTEALDLRHQLAVMSLLRAKAETGIVVGAVHDLDLARRFASRIVLLDRGRLVADGAPAQTLSEDRLKSVFGVERTALGYRLSG